MINMTTALIFAGGTSTRMGRDKAKMFGGVSRLYDECVAAKITEVITLCGSQERRSNFPGKVWTDPQECNNLIQVIQWAINRINDDIILIPCDAFNLTVNGITELTLLTNCVPSDELGARQPLHARITDKTQINWQANSISGLFEDFDTHQSKILAAEFTNFNSPEDLKNHRLQ